MRMFHLVIVNNLFHLLLNLNTNLIQFIWYKKVVTVSRFKIKINQNYRKRPIYPVYIRIRVIRKTLKSKFHLTKLEINIIP